MTSHIPGYDPGPKRLGGLATIREDIHVHIGAPQMRALIGDPTSWRAWLPEGVRDFRADTEGVGFIIGLPGRDEAYSLRRAPADDPREVVYRLDEGGVAESVSWGLHPEGVRECHVTVEVAYRPASGFVGGAMETLMHRPQRVQVLRDLLWNLKRAVEGTAAAEAASA